MTAEFVGLLVVYLAVLLAIAPCSGATSVSPWKTGSPG